MVLKSLNQTLDPSVAAELGMDGGVHAMQGMQGGEVEEVEEDPMVVDPERMGEVVGVGGAQAGERGGRETVAVLPLFVLRWQLPLVPGGKFVYNIFEPRYKHMIKQVRRLFFL